MILGTLSFFSVVSHGITPYWYPVQKILGWAKKKQKCENLFRKYLMWCSITQGLLVNFYFFSKMGSKGLSRGGQSLKKLILKMFQTTPCGYSKLVSQEAWYSAKGFSSIRSSCPEKTSKKWSEIAHLSVELNMPIFRNILGVFSSLDARIKLIPFALYQAPRDTSLEYPHEVVWNILKINFFKDSPPLRDP